MKTLLRLFFKLLYHQFAFAYDLVAAGVSFGQWRDWVMEAVPFIEGTRVLEIGHGPGHLQRVLLSRNMVAVGLDESAQMTRLAKKRLENGLSDFRSNTGSLSTRPGCTQISLARGLAQHLPFRNESFESIVATFPSEYITDPRTLTEVRRCLVNGGRLVVLPVAIPRNGFLSWLFRVTGEAPSDAVKFIQEKLGDPFMQAGFDAEMHVLEIQSSTLVVIVAKNKVTVV